MGSMTGKATWRSRKFGPLSIWQALLYNAAFCGIP